MFFAQSSFATCGGGGGGGGGGISAGGAGGGNAPVYVRALENPQANGSAGDAGLVLYWFPASENEVKNSSCASRASFPLRIAMRVDGSGRRQNSKCRHADRRIQTSGGGPGQSLTAPSSARLKTPTAN